MKTTRLLTSPIAIEIPWKAPYDELSPASLNDLDIVVQHLSEERAKPIDLDYERLLEPVDYSRAHMSEEEFLLALDERECHEPQCMCEHSRFWAYVMHEIDCDDYSVMYWYHPDYLGNTEYVTDMAGEPYQYFWYSPWGEPLVEEHSLQGSFYSPYLFNAKELDMETGNYYYGARYYSPKTSIWLSVDPMASSAPQHTPYSFCFNNPVMFYDPDGRWPYKITFRSFHPNTSFGGGTLLSFWQNFDGDGRSFSLSDNVSSRIVHQVIADPETGSLDYAGRGQYGTYANPSHHPIYGRDEGQPDGYIGKKRLGSNSISFLTGYQGANPLMPSPYINVDGRFEIIQDGNVLIIKGKVNGDDFPNTEAFIEDPSGQRLFIGKDERASGYDDNPTILFGPSTERIMDINMRIQIDPNSGNFLKVLQGMGSIGNPSNGGSGSSSNGGSHKNPRYL